MINLRLSIILLLALTSVTLLSRDVAAGFATFDTPNWNCGQQGCVMADKCNNQLLDLASGKGFDGDLGFYKLTSEPIFHVNENCKITAQTLIKGQVVEMSAQQYGVLNTIFHWKCQAYIKAHPEKSLSGRDAHNELTATVRNIQVKFIFEYIK